MKKTLNMLFLSWVLCAAGFCAQAAAGTALDFTLESLGGPFAPLYRVTGSGVNLEIKYGGFPNDTYAKYDVTGNIFGRQLASGNYIKHEDFGGRTGVQIDAAGMYARFFRQAGWPDLNVETRVDQNMDAASAMVFSVLGNYLPKLNGAANMPGNYQPMARFSLRQFGPGMVLVEGQGLSNLRVERVQWGQGYRYTVRGSGFGKNFDGADRLEFETDASYLGQTGLRVRGCGMNLEIRADGFAGNRITVMGTSGDSSALVVFTAAFARYLQGN